MPKTTKGTSEFAFPPNKLLDVLLNEGYQVESAKLDEAVKDARFIITSKTDARAVCEIRSTEYERGMSGIDKKKTVETITKIEWDLKTMSSTWVYTNPSQDRFKLSGTSRITATSKGCSLTSEATVEVKIPLVGGKVESMVAEGIEKSRAKDAALMQEWAKKILPAQLY